MTKLTQRAREPRSGNRAQRHCKKRNLCRVHSQAEHRADTGIPPGFVQAVGHARADTTLLVTRLPNSQKHNKRAWTRCAVRDTTPRGSGEPGGSGRGACVRGALNNRAPHRSPRTRHRRAQRARQNNRRHTNKLSTERTCFVRFRPSCGTRTRGRA